MRSMPGRLLNRGIAVTVHILVLICIFLIASAAFGFFLGGQFRKVLLHGFVLRSGKGNIVPILRVVQFMLRCTAGDGTLGIRADDLDGQRPAVAVRVLIARLFGRRMEMLLSLWSATAAFATGFFVSVSVTVTR